MRKPLANATKGNVEQTDQWAGRMMDGWTNRRTDRPTDRPTVRRSEIRHDMTKLKFGKTSSHFSTSQPYYTTKMTTDLDEVLHGATHVSWEPTFLIL